MVSQAITVKVLHQRWCKVSQQKPVVVGSQSGNHHKSFTSELKVSQQKPVVVRGQSGNRRKSFTPELVQSLAAKASSRVWSVTQSP